MSKLLKQMQGVKEELPQECWESIFNRLDSGDLKNASLVCKSFWTNINLVKKRLKVIHPKVAMLSKLLKRFSKLQSVDLTEFGGDLDEALCEIAHSATHIDSIHLLLPRNALLSATLRIETLRELGSRLTLKAFSWPGNDLLLILRCLPHLEELNLYHYGFLDQDHPGIEVFAFKCNMLSLRKIHLVGIHGLSDEFVIILSLNCLSLKDISIIFHGGKITEHGIGHLLRNRPPLESIYVGEVQKESPSQVTISNSIGHAKCLTSVGFQNMDVSDDLLLEMENAKLQSFAFKFCKKFTLPALVGVLSNRLTKLTIRGTIFGDDDIRLLSTADIGNVEHIEISGLQVKNSTLFLLLSKCTSLREIKIDMVTALNDNYIAFSTYCKIRNLHITHWKVTEAMQFGVTFPNVRILDFHCCPGLTSRVIQSILKHCKYLAELALRGYRDTKLMEVEFDVEEVNLKVLDLGSSCIDDDGFAAITTKCRQLVKLDLSGCYDVSTKNLKLVVNDLKNLTKLHLKGCPRVEYEDLLEWLLTANFSRELKVVYLGNGNYSSEQKDRLLELGCLIE